MSVWTWSIAGIGNTTLVAVKALCGTSVLCSRPLNILCKQSPFVNYRQLLLLTVSGLERGSETSHSRTDLKSDCPSQRNPASQLSCHITIHSHGANKKVTGIYELLQTVTWSTFNIALSRIINRSRVTGFNDLGMSLDNQSSFSRIAYCTYWA